MALQKAWWPCNLGLLNPSFMLPCKQFFLCPCKRELIPAKGFLYPYCAIGFASAPLQKTFLMPLQKGTAWALQKSSLTFPGHLTLPLLLCQILCPCKRELRGPCKRSPKNHCPIYCAIDFTTPDFDWQESFLVSLQKGTGSCKRLFNPHWELTAPLLLQAAKNGWEMVLWKLQVT